VSSAFNISSIPRTIRPRFCDRLPNKLAGFASDSQAIRISHTHACLLIPLYLTHPHMSVDVSISYTHACLLIPLYLTHPHMSVDVSISYTHACLLIPLYLTHPRMSVDAIQYLTHPSACLLIQSSISHTLPRVC
jgi:hypothetical protein